MRPTRTFAILPTMFTLGNLVCGFFAIVIASRVPTPTLDRLAKALADDAENCMISAWLIFAAMVFDALDGYIARLTNAASEFGAELDSLCDMVSFGIAPAFLLVKMCPQFSIVFHKQYVWVIAASYAACAGLRLARFNVDTSDEDDHMTFRGLPSPAAAASIAGFAIMFNTLRSQENPLQFGPQIDVALQFALPFFAVLLAALMVSRIPYPHVVNQVFRGQRTLRHLVGIIFSLVAVMVVRDYAVSIVCVSFALYGPIRFAWELLVQKKHQEERIL